MKFRALIWKADVKCKFTCETVVCNTVVEEKSNSVFNFVVLVVKQFIYRCKCQGTNPNFSQAIKEIKLNYRIEQNNACKTGKVPKSRKYWKLVVDAFKLTL